MPIDIPSSIKELIRHALEEDIGSGDITTSLVIPQSHESTGLIVAKESFILAGMPFAMEVYNIISESVTFEPLIEDGTRVKKGDIVAEINGKTSAILKGERLALNILQRLSGIATLTNKFVQKVKGTKAKILDTRKTTPCMRYMEKYAVRVGGGRNHRFGLYDGILIKDNHIEAAGDIKRAIELAKEGRHLSKIEVEAETLKEVKDALEAGADIIMLDNMPINEIKEAVRIVKGRVLLEVSGNVSLENVREIAETGVELISVGAITHSAPASDISMKIITKLPEEEFIDNG